MLVYIIRVMLTFFSLHSDYNGVCGINFLTSVLEIISQEKVEKIRI